MSDETFAALEDAIRAHVADEGEGEMRVLTDWYLISAAAGSDPTETNYLHVCPGSSPIHTLYGLVDLAQRRLLGEAGGLYE